MLITKEYLESISWLKHDEYQENLLRKTDDFGPDYIEFVSDDGRLLIRNTGNLSNKSWWFHLDNEDMDSLAGFDVETIEDANTILNVYKYKNI